MIHQGKCPKCGKPVLHVHIESLNGIVADDPKAKCLSFCCIHCFAVLGVQMDPRGTRRRPKAAAETDAKAAK